MPKFVRMRRAFSYEQDDGSRRTIPSGWAGNLEDAIAQKAIDGGFTREERARAAPAPVTTTEGNEGAQGTEGDNEKLEDKTREELDVIARAQNIDPGDYRTKADLIEAINKAGAGN